MLFVVELFWRRGRGSRRLALAAPADTAVSSKEAALVAVSDLDCDFQTGKVTKADYQPLRQPLLLAAGQAASAEAASRPAARTSRRMRPDDDIEAAVRELRLGGHGTRPPAPETCAACGAVDAGTDKFCGHYRAALGLVLISGGAWWLRRNTRQDAQPEATNGSEASSEPASDDEWNHIVRAMAELDAAHERGEVADQDHAAARAKLKARTHDLLAAEQAGQPLETA